MFWLSIVDAHARARYNPVGLVAALNGDATLLVDTMVAPTGVYAQRGTHFAGPGEQGGALDLVAPLKNCLKSRHRLARADEDRCAFAFGIGDNIDQVMNAVTQIDIQMASRAPHGRVTGRMAAMTMVGRVIRKPVGFYFCDT